MLEAVAVLLVGFAVAVLMTPAGISGAFLLVPFQTSVLGATSVSVTPTNLIFNLIATPMAIAVFRRRGRLDGRLAALITGGSLPGVLLGVWLRIHVLADPARFRVVMGLVLVALALGLVAHRRTVDEGEQVARHRAMDTFVVVVSAAIGVLGGVYGVGGGVFLAPLLATTTGCSLRQIAGATLVGTWVTSVTGVAAFALASWSRGDPAMAPNWRVGLLLGLGGLPGGLLGASLQPHVPERGLRAVLAVTVGGLGLFYLVR